MSLSSYFGFQKPRFDSIDDELLNIADTSTRPAADAVKTGTAFIAIDGGEYNATVSDGSEWRDA